MGDPQSLKEEGNGYFKGGQYKEALRCYTKALEGGSMKDADKAVIYKNRAACRLKLNDNLAAIDDSTACKPTRATASGGCWFLLLFTLLFCVFTLVVMFQLSG